MKHRVYITIKPNNSNLCNVNVNSSPGFKFHVVSAGKGEQGMQMQMDKSPISFPSLERSVQVAY